MSSGFGRRYDDRREVLFLGGPEHGRLEYVRSNALTIDFPVNPRPQISWVEDGFLQPEPPQYDSISYRIQYLSDDERRGDSRERYLERRSDEYPRRPRSEGWVAVCETLPFETDSDRRQVLAMVSHEIQSRHAQAEMHARLAVFEQKPFIKLSDVREHKDLFSVLADQLQESDNLLGDKIRFMLTTVQQETKDDNDTPEK